MTGSRLYGVGKGKRKLLSKSPTSARQQANHMRVGVGSSKRGAWQMATNEQRKAWKPKRRRRKLGARRKVSVVQALFRWIRIPTGRVRKRTRRR